MCALLDDIAVLQHQNQVGVFDGGQPVGDDKAGAVFRQPVHGLLGDELCAGIHRGGGLVQNQHGIALNHGPGDGEQLLLPGGNGNAVIQHGIKAVGQGFDEVIDAAGPAGLLQLLVRDPGLVVDQIFTDSPLKQPGVLEYHAEQVVDALPGHFRGGHAVDFDVSAVDLKEAHQQIDHRGLARSGGTHNSHLLPRLNMGREVLDDDLIRMIRIAESDVFKFDFALHRREFGALAGLIGQLFLVEKVEGRGRRRLPPSASGSCPGPGCSGER